MLLARLRQQAVLVVGGATLAAVLAGCTSGGSASPESRAPVKTLVPISTSVPSSTPMTTGSSSSTPATGTTLSAAYVGKVDAVCAVGVEYVRAHPFPFPDFDPSNPKPSELKRIATYEKSTPDIVARLLALAPPAKDAAGWRTVTAVLTRLHKNEAAQTTAAASGDAQDYARAAKDGGSIAVMLRGAAAQAGLLRARSCVTYFTG